MSKRLIVIGAGLAGLSAGIHSALNGFETLVLEQAARPGGVAGAWRRKGYAIDGGIHFYTGWRPGGATHELFRTLGVADAENYVPLTHYARFQDLSEGLSLDVTADLDRLERNLLDAAPDDAGFVRRMIQGARRFTGMDLADGITPARELWNTRVLADLFWKQRRALPVFASRLMWRSAGDIARGLRSPWLADIVRNLFLPEVPLLFPCMLLGVLSSGQMALRRDGSAGFVAGLVRRLESLGGELRCKARVASILRAHGRVHGLRLDTGEELSADHVIAAGDGHETLFRLLEGQHIPGTLRRAHERWPLFRPIIMLNFGLRRHLEAPWLIILPRPPRLKAGFVSEGAWSVRLFNHAKGFAPEGRTLIQVMLETSWEPWAKLDRESDAYALEKSAVARETLVALENLWPGVSREVDMTDVATPLTWRRYTLNHRGAWEGFLPTPKAFRTSLPRRLPGLSGLSLAGQWVMPGGGVVPSLLSGRDAVRLV